MALECLCYTVPVLCIQVFPHEYRRALAEMAMESQEKMEVQKQQENLSNEFSIDIIPSEDDLKTSKDKVSWGPLWPCECWDCNPKIMDLIPGTGPRADKVLACMGLYDVVMATVLMCTLRLRLLYGTLIYLV